MGFFGAPSERGLAGTLPSHPLIVTTAPQQRRIASRKSAKEPNDAQRSVVADWL